MGQKLEGGKLELYRRVDEVLHYIWDPIGIAGTPEARDEYDGYLGHVFSLLIQNQGEEAIRSYLLEIERDRMGMTVTEESIKRTDRATESILEWQRVISERQNKLSSS